MPNISFCFLPLFLPSSLLSRLPTFLLTFSPSFMHLIATARSNGHLKWESGLCSDPGGIKYQEKEFEQRAVVSH